MTCVDNPSCTRSTTPMTPMNSFTMLCPAPMMATRTTVPIWFRDVTA